MRLIVLLFTPFLSLAQSKVDQKILLIDNKVEILVPKELAQMTDEMWKAKYGSAAKRPLLALSDNVFEVSLVAQMTAQELSDAQLEEYKQYRIDNLKKTRSDIKILEEGIKTINGKKVGFFKFNSQAIGDKILNYYFFFTVDGKVILFSFNCAERLQSTWAKAADEIIQSLKVK